MRHVRILFCLIMKTHCTLRSRGVNTSSEIRRPLRRDSCAFPAEITPRHPTTAAAELIRPPFVLHLSLCANAKSVTGHSWYATRIDSDESIRVSRQCGICACVSARWSVCWWLGCKWIPEVIQCCDSSPPSLQGEQRRVTFYSKDRFAHSHCSWPVTSFLFPARLPCACPMWEQ